MKLHMMKIWLMIATAIIAGSGTIFASNPRSIVADIAQAATAKTVVDYFLQTPDRYFKILDRDRVTPAVRRKLLQQSGTIADIKNGYISVSSIAPDLCRYEMAIFRRTRGSHLVALNLACTVADKLMILDPDRSWQDITKIVFPIETIEPGKNYTIRLPRQGRTIEILDENNRSTASVKFDNGKFRVIN